jgi:thiol-disulfide isomerase/thioredoxin
MFKALAAALCLTALAAPAVAAPAPRVEISSYAQLRTPLPFPYDERADANAAVAAGRARALREHKLLMIDLGGNWCADCRILAGTMDLPSLHAFVEAHYVVVFVDVGRFDRNLQIPAHYGITQRLEGVPSLLIVDPATDRLLDPGQDAAIQDARHFSPQALADWVAQWSR